MTQSQLATKAAAMKAAGAEAQAARLLNSAIVRDLCGGVSDMTLWRWLHDDSLGFPRPIYISRRRYWREADIIAWLDRHDAALAEAE